MNISAKTEYACLAMIELAAQHANGEPVRIRTIADRHGIPSRFLVQILLQLKSAGLVASTRGASGGYQLMRDPREISLAEVMDVIDGRTAHAPGGAAVDSPLCRTLMAVWAEVSDAERRLLADISLLDVLARKEHAGQPMYYI